MSAGSHDRSLSPNVVRPVLNQTAEYSLRVAVLLAAGDPERLWRAGELATELDIPANYLSKLLHQLARADVLASRRGRDGGFRLARPASTITLADVIRPFDHHGRRPGCLLGVGDCDPGRPCAMHAQWKPLSDAMTVFFNETHLDALALKNKNAAG